MVQAVNMGICSLHDIPYDVKNMSLDWQLCQITTPASLCLG